MNGWKRKQALHREAGEEGTVAPDVTPRNIDGEDSSEKNWPGRSTYGPEGIEKGMDMPPGMAGNNSEERKKDDKNHR